MAEQMEQLKKDVRDLKETVGEIHTALIGNIEMRQKGIAHTVESHDDYIERDKRFKAKAVGIIAGVQLAIAAFLTWFKLKL